MDDAAVLYRARGGLVPRPTRRDLRDYSPCALGATGPGAGRHGAMSTVNLGSPAVEARPPASPTRARPTGQEPNRDFHEHLRAKATSENARPRELSGGYYDASVGRSLSELHFSGFGGWAGGFGGWGASHVVGRFQSANPTEGERARTAGDEPATRDPSVPNADDSNVDSLQGHSASAADVEQVHGSLEDPLMRSLSHPMHGAEPQAQLLASVPSGAAAAERVAWLASQFLATQWLRRFGHGGTGGSACVRLELGAGKQAGTELIVSGDRSELRIVMRSPEGADASGLAEGLRSRLRERGFQHVEIELD